MSEFARGPWEVDSCYWRGAVPDSCRGEWDTQNKSVRASGLSICMVQGDNEKPMEANASLIAAAPDMYEALRGLLRRDEEKQCRFCSKDEWGSEKHDSNCPFGMAYLALRKANGESTYAPGA